MVPRCACSNRPDGAATAPVNAPLSCPNSSDATSAGGIAAQFMSTKGSDARRERLWMARAISSFPVPVSPRISTVESVGATASTSPSIARSGALVPMMPSKPSSEPPRSDGHRRFALPGDRLFDRPEQIPINQWLGQELMGAGFHRPNRHRNVAVSGEEDDRDLLVCPGKLLLKIEPAQAGQLHVQHEAARDLLAGRGEKLLRRGKRLHVPSGRSDEAAHCFSHRRIVIDDIDRGCCGHAPGSPAGVAVPPVSLPDGDLKALSTALNTSSSLKGLSR